jgi:small conductance mechanosensitive channel
MNPEEILRYKEAAQAWALEAIPTLVGALLLWWAGWWAIGKANRALQKAMDHRRLDPGLITFLSTLFVTGSRIVLLITVAGQLGFPTTSLAAVVGAIGLAVGFALQGSLANLAGGVLILLFKPYRVGDRIEANGYTGKVKEIQIFNTLLALDSGSTALLPNGAVANAAVVNHSASEPVFRHWEIQVPRVGQWPEAEQRVHQILDEEKIPAEVHLAGLDPAFWTVEVHAAGPVDDATAQSLLAALSHWTGASAKKLR